MTPISKWIGATVAVAFPLSVLAACKARKFNQTAGQVRSASADDMVDLRLADATNPAFNPARAPANPLFNESWHSANTNCVKCHPVQHEEWRQSNHAQAVRDPLFNWLELKANLVNGGQFRSTPEAKQPNFCVRCHAPAAAYDNVAKDPRRTLFGQLADAKHAVGMEGVTCLACHGVLKDPKVEQNGLKAKGFNEGVNTMHYDPTTKAVRTGPNYAMNPTSIGAINMRSRRKAEDGALWPVAKTNGPDTHVILEQHRENTFHPEVKSHWEKRYDLDQDNTSANNQNVGDRIGVCGSCHKVRLLGDKHEPGQAFDQYKPFEQLTSIEWQTSTSFPTLGCMDCHMSSYPDAPEETLKNVIGEKGDVIKSRDLKAPGEHFPLGKASHFPNSKERRRASHRFPGGYNVPLADYSFQEHKSVPVARLAERKVLMYKRSFDLTITPKGDACGKVALNARVDPTKVVSGHKMPTGLSHIREIWLQTTVSCGGKVVFASGVPDARGYLQDAKIAFKKYSEVGAGGAVDLWYPAYEGPGPDTHLFSLQRHFGDAKEGRVFDFVKAETFERTDRGKGGPSQLSQEHVYPEIDLAACKGMPVEVSSKLNLRFFAPWVLEDVYRNIQSGRESARLADAGTPPATWLGFPREALADVGKGTSVGTLEEITGETMRANAIHLITETKETLPACK